uniref:Uncharacterized protein n=1 Tax=Ananas comosus var. bracteatus TaxID=296719 RepID=A0A6V7NJ69_ANACO|nr:unnamed protein product [Ananas comosus var. bracteatus]
MEVKGSRRRRVAPTKSSDLGEVAILQRHMAGLDTHRAGLCRVPGRDNVVVSASIFSNEFAWLLSYVLVELRTWVARMASGGVPSLGVKGCPCWGHVLVGDLSSADRMDPYLLKATLGLLSAHGVTGDRSMVVPLHILYRYTFDGCTGTLVAKFKPEPRVCIFVGFVPVHFPVYRYTLADCEQFELQGVLAIVASLYQHPRPLELSLSWEHRRRSLPRRERLGTEGRGLLRASSSVSDELIGVLPLDVFILERLRAVPVY